MVAGLHGGSVGGLFVAGGAGGGLALLVGVEVVGVGNGQVEGEKARDDDKRRAADHQPHDAVAPPGAGVRLLQARARARAGG